MRWLFVMVAFAIGIPQSAAAQELELDRVIAVINSDIVLASELERRMLGQTATKGATDPKKAMLWAMVDELLLVQQAKAAGLAASETDVERALEAIRQNAGLSEKQLLEELKKQGYSVSDFRRTVARQLLANRFMAIEVRPRVEVTEQDARKLYAERIKSTDGKPAAKFSEVSDALRREIFEKRIDLARDRLLVELRRRAFIDVRLREASPK